jgi:hypothetical protein
MKKTDFNFPAMSGRLLQKAAGSIAVAAMLMMFACIALFACCDEDWLTSEDKGEKASAEFCECMKKNTLSECENELNTKYGYYSNDDDFIKAFNNANDCDITISKKK